MPKVKIPRKSTSIDMTAMCDVAFLLLTFFMLTTKFKPDEPITVDTPSSISEELLPESDMMQVLVDKEGRVFFGIDGQNERDTLLTLLEDYSGAKFTTKERNQFKLLANFGVPLKDLPALLDMTGSERNEYKQPGIPIDSLHEELGTWLMLARNVKKYKLAIKGDKDVPYPVVKQIFDILSDRHLPQFHFITSLESAPDEYIAPIEEIAPKK